MAGVVESLKGAGAIGVVVFILAVVGNFLNWIAFTTASWARGFLTAASVGDTYRGYGLWRICDSGDGVVGACSMVDGTNVAYYGVVQAFVTIGFIGLNVMCLIIVLKMFTGICNSVGDIDKVNAIQAIVTGVFYLIGIIIFGVEYGDGEKLKNVAASRDGDLGYSFILAIFAMVIQIVVAIIILVMGMKGGSVGQSSK